MTSNTQPSPDSTTAPFPSLATCTVAVIGLGYVGLPLSVAFATAGICVRTGKPLKRRVIGFDINKQRLSELRVGHDSTNETSSKELKAATMLEFTADPAELAVADVFVVTVPTPIDNAKRPDLTPLENASGTVGLALKERYEQQRSTGKIPSLPLVIYESTVYPGATEEVCVPVLERISGLTYNNDFFCGYSPERINPGDTEHRLTKITKVTSGSTPEAAAWVDGFYGSIIQAGTHQGASIKVAEAAKVIENTQRDLNIALVNELAIIFREMGIDTLDVLKAAGTKWNFLPFRPGLVGGHCIGVDPYYLTHKAEQLGYHPEVVLAGRRINDGMASWLAQQLVLGMAQRKLPVVGAKVLLLGFSFKENCPDFRNTKVVDLYLSLEQYGMEISIVDPRVDSGDAFDEYGISISSDLPKETFNAVVLAVAHAEFVNLTLEQWTNLLSPSGIFLDLKDTIPRILHPLRV